MKQIINRGYLTHAITDQNGNIYGLIESSGLDFTYHIEKLGYSFYWSDVYKDGNLSCIVRRGMVMLNKSEEDFQKYFMQSKINLDAYRNVPYMMDRIESGYYDEYLKDIIM